MNAPRRTVPKTVWLIGFIIVLGLIPRAVELVSGNYLFGYDQGLFYEKVRSIVIDHKLTLIGEEVGGRGGFFQGPGFYYLLSIPFALFRGDPYGGTVLMFLTGLATLAVAAYGTYRFLGKTEAVFVALLLAFSPGMISQSRFVWNPFFVPFLTVLILFSFFAVLRKRPNALPLMFFCIALLFHFEIATGIMTFVQYVLFTAYLWVRRVIKPRDILLSAAAFALPLLNFAAFDVRHDFLITRGILGYAGSSYPHAMTRTYVLSMLGNHWDVFRNQFVGTFAYGTHAWPLIAAMLALGALGIVRDRRMSGPIRLFAAFLAVSPVLMFVLYTRYLLPMWEWWILELGVAYCLLGGLILARTWKWGPPGRVVVVAVVVLLTVSHVQSIVRFYRTDYADYGGTHKIRGKKDAIDFIYRDVNGGPFGILVFAPPVYTYPYDYLFKWYGSKTYGYVPETGKRGITYLLIEPDPQKPWSYKGWLETVVRDGKTVSSWTLPSGFIIEKRIYP